MKYIIYMGGRKDREGIEAIFDLDNKNYPGFDLKIEADSEQELITESKKYFWGLGDKASLIFSGNISKELRERIKDIPYKKERRVEDKPVEVERRKSLDEKIKSLFKKIKDSIILPLQP